MARKVGLIGIGIMGSAMAANMLEGGLTVTGYDIDGERMAWLAQTGGATAPSPRAVIESSEVVILSLPSVAAFRDVVYGKDGIRETARADAIVADTSTLPLEEKLEAHGALKAVGVDLLDCPLSGTGAQALTKDLAVYGSGDKTAFNACTDVFPGFARAHYYLGDFGNGSRMKFVANLLVSIHNVAAAEAFALGMKSGLDAATIYKVISDGAGSSRMFEVRGPMMVEGRYDDATMKVDVWQKDVSVINAFARSLDCPIPLFSAAEPIYAAAMAQGWGKKDTAAVCAVLEAMAGLARGNAKG